MSLANVFADHPALKRRPDRWQEGIRAAADVLAPKAPPKAALQLKVGPRLPMLQFGQRYFPHRLEHAPSILHREICEELERILSSTESEADAFAAPRGNAKTTWISLIFVIYCIVYDLKRFIIEITNESSLAVELVEDVAHELEDNEELAADFPHACGRGPTWKKGIGVIVTKNDVKVQGFGSGKKVRGRKHREHRPDLVIGDDLENDEQCRSREQRVKFRNWWNKAVMKMRGPGRKFDAVVAGTVMHFDSFLAGLLDPRKSPGWRSRRYQSVIKWSERGDLWDAWQALYTDFTKPDDVRQRDAHAFFLEHQALMLRGTEVLWPEGEPYYDLMKLRVNDGPASFDSEKQNQPIDPETCFFKEEWFKFFTEVEIGGEWWLVVPDGEGESVRLADCDLYGSLDPSMGKRDKGGDPSALVSIACYPAERLNRGRYRSYWVVDADIALRHPHDQLALIFERHIGGEEVPGRGYRRFGIEAIQFQELFADDVREAALNDPRYAGLIIRDLKPHSDKALRIQKLEPFIYSGRLKFAKKLTALYNQLRYYTNPPQDHDDGPDAVEQCLETIGAINVTVLGGGSYDDDPNQPRKSGFQRQLQQLHDSLPKGTAADVADTCGNCGARGEKNGKPFCLARNFNIQLSDPACHRWEPGEG